MNTWTFILLAGFSLLILSCGLSKAKLAEQTQAAVTATAAAGSVRNP